LGRTSTFTFSRLLVRVLCIPDFSVLVLLTFLHICSYVSFYWLLLFCTYVLTLVCNRRTTNVVWWWWWDMRQPGKLAVFYLVWSYASAEYWIHFTARFGGVLAFVYNSAESEPILMKSAALWVHCRELALADFGHDQHSSNSWTTRRNFLSGKQRTISHISRRPNCTVLWLFKTIQPPSSQSVLIHWLLRIESQSHITIEICKVPLTKWTVVLNNVNMTVK